MRTERCKIKQSHKYTCLQPVKSVLKDASMRVMNISSIMQTSFSGVFPLDARANCAVRELFFVSAVSLPGASLSFCCHSGVSLMSGITSEVWRAVDHEGQERITFTSSSPSQIIASPSLSSLTPFLQPFSVGLHDAKI